MRGLGIGFAVIACLGCSQESDSGGAASGGGGAGSSGGNSGSGGGTGGSVSPGDNGYYESLAARSDVHFTASLRSDVEINAHRNGKPHDPPDVVYDPAADGARMRMPSGAGSIATQIRLSFPAVASGNLLFYWEGRWEAGFVSDGDVDGLQTNKAYQLARSGPGDNRRIEARTRFALVDSPFVAAVDTRSYWFAPAQGSDQPVQPQVGSFDIKPDTWTRFWAFVDFANGQYSYLGGRRDFGPGGDSRRHRHRLLTAAARGRARPGHLLVRAQLESESHCGHAGSVHLGAQPGGAEGRERRVRRSAELPAVGRGSPRALGDDEPVA